MSGKKSKKVKRVLLWEGITDKDFEDESNVIEENMVDYNLEKMTIFSANTNYFRQIVKLSDSLKPVERRLLYMMYSTGTRPGTKSKKTSLIVSDTMSLHAHGDVPIYKSLVGLAQPWKTPVPLITGFGNFGNAGNPTNYASSRYTEATLSRYAYECFFSDYDGECVETLFNTSIDGPEPLSLPAKFPNILINGGMGFAPGNAFAIPPYNISDIIDLCKRLIINPNDPNIYMIPDLPTGCDIVDDGTSLREICDTGKGVLRMRATIDIEEKSRTWVLAVSNIPWMVSLKTVNDAIVDLTKKGILPIKDIQDKSEQIVLPNKNIETVINYQIVIDKAHDPYVIRDRLFKLTGLGKSLGINFKVVLEGLAMGQLNMRELTLAWLDERRGYKRRLLNKSIIKISARISLLDVLIRITDKDNLAKTVRIVSSSNLSEVVSSLMEHGKMTSFQATRIAEMRLTAFAKDARDKYIDEKNKLEIELKDLMELIKSEKRIDKIILRELDDLQKYASPRKTNVISSESNVQVSETDHIITVSNQGYIKKLLDMPNRTTYGAFKNLDYPKHKVHVNNLEAIIFFDSLGRFTSMPVYEITNSEMSSFGTISYETTKLDGNIISVFPGFKESTADFIQEELNDGISLVTLTRNGYLKKTGLDEFNKMKNTRNVRAVRLKDDDTLIFADVLLDSSDVMIFTKKGKYIFISAEDIAQQSKDSMGLLSLKLADGDECAGLTVIGKRDRYVLVVTEKGTMKKCEIEYLGSAGKRRVAVSYLTTLDENDVVQTVDTMRRKSIVTIVTRGEIIDYEADAIPTLGRRAKGRKLIPLPVGSNIITVGVKDKEKKKK